MNCRFNAKHEMPRPELRHHEMNCPDRAVLDQDFKYGNKQIYYCLFAKQFISAVLSVSQ